MTDLKNNRLRKFGILSLALYLATNNIINGALIFMQKDLGISLGSAEFLVTLSAISTVIFILLSETITRKIGIKNCVKLGLFLVGLSGLLPLVSKTYISVFISRLILGCGIGLFNGHSANLINIFYKNDQASHLHGIRNSMEYAGQMLLLFIAELLVKFGWNYAFIAYSLAFLILIFFSKNVEDVEVDLEREKFKINKQIFFYILFAGFMVLNTTAVSIKFPYIASMTLGMNANINMLMMVLPLSGMVSGFLFGRINKILRSKTILFGIILYIITNILLGAFGSNIYIYMVSMAMTSFAQSLCTPYIFIEIARFSRSSSSRIINNLIFVGCNLGGFLASIYLNTLTKILKLSSPTLAFMSFGFFYAILFAVFFYEYLSVRAYK